MVIGRNISPVQVALVVALGGSVLAVFLPKFLGDLNASRLAEPLDGLSHLAAAGAQLAAGLPPEVAFPESAPRTPQDVPAGERVADPPGTWNHPTWRTLGFSFSDAHSYSFSFDTEADEAGAQFVARAFGDLDGDGELSRFEVLGDVRGTGEPTIYPVRIEREVE